MARVSEAQKKRDSVSYLRRNGYVVQEENQIRCMCCGKHKTAESSANFWMSFSPLHLGNTAKVKQKDKEGNVTIVEKSFAPICKTCAGKLLGDGSKENLFELLRILDRPFVKDTWKNAMNKKGVSKMTTVFGNYLSNIALNQKDLRFKDSEMYESECIEDNDTGKSKNELKVTKKKMSELEDKYGYGYTKEEYLNFERKYEKIKVGYKEKTALHTERLIDYIIKKVKEEMAIARGDVADAAKYETMSKNAATAAKLNVSQLSKSDITGGVDLLPQLVEAVEERVSLIPIMPKIKAVPYDDIDMNIYALVNYYRRLEDKPPIDYKDVWSFYDDFVYEHFRDQGYGDDEIEKIKSERGNVFKDLGKNYTEPLYYEHHRKEKDEESE